MLRNIVYKEMGFKDILYKKLFLWKKKIFLLIWIKKIILLVILREILYFSVKLIVLV